MVTVYEQKFLRVSKLDIIVVHMYFHVYIFTYLNMHNFSLLADCCILFG